MTRAPSRAEFFPVEASFVADTLAEDDVDLFGAPVTQLRERWGRPSFSKTTENQQTVVSLRGAGWSQDRIAAYLGCDAKTLRKHFSRELRLGVEYLEGMALEVLVAKMRAGHVGAAKEVWAYAQRVKAAEKPTETEPMVGKKEAARQAAEAVHRDSGWTGLLKH
jgi:hypothetical protein